MTVSRSVAPAVVYDAEHVCEYIKVLAERCDRYGAALREISTRPVVERNPDGDDQAAHTMQLIAREAICHT